MIAVAVVAASSALAGHGPAAAAEGALGKVTHIVIVYMENRSFDNLFGGYPGANGISSPGAAIEQKALDGTTYEVLPETKGPFDVEGNRPEVRAIQLGRLPNRPFAIDAISPLITLRTVDRGLTHLFYTNREQINGGANDLFAALSDAGGMSMGYYSAAAMQDTHLWKAARQGVLFDNLFQGAFGGSFLNHIWFVCTCPAVWPHPPDDQRSVLGQDTVPPHDRRVTAKGEGDYAVNTTQSVFLNNGREGDDLLPPQTAITIGDRLSERGIDWAWYSEGWNLAINQRRTPEQQKELDSMLFAYHHQPFAYFDRFDPATAHGRAQRRIHLRDGQDFEVDVLSGQLPPVSIYKPDDVESQHPGLGSVGAGDAGLGRVMDLLERSPISETYALIITYDENGGFFDHVPPPMGAEAGERADFFGPGTRIPTILVSPLIQPGAIDSTEFESTSILRLIADRFELDPLPSPRYRAVKSLTEAFERHGKP
jgi:phospholipase C